MLNEGDAEFLVERAQDGRLRIRVGQIWKMEERKGKTILQCDYDNCKKIDRKTIRRRLEKAGVTCLAIRSRQSPSGTGVHALVSVSGVLNRFQRIALQAILESDPEREAQNYRRARQAGPKWKDNWQVLFK